MSVEEALRNPQWKRAMLEEMNSLNHMKTWTLTELPEGRKPLTCKWVLRIKGNGQMKARLVARGYEQKHGVDYENTFAPVARHASIRLLLSYAAKEETYIKTFDVKTAFLNGELNEEIFMTQPEGFEDGSEKVCKLLKSLYGLKQAPRSWNEKFTSYLRSLKYEDTDDDPCLFYNNSKSVLIPLFVDDGLIIGKDEIEVNDVLSKVARKFEVTSESPKQGKLYYLGMEICLMRNGIFVNQLSYTRRILDKFGFAEAYPVATRMKPGMITEKHTNDKELKGKMYREAIGSLLYLSTISRPGISFAVHYLSRQVCNPMFRHWKMTE